MVGGPLPDAAVLERMAAAMAHRGPDGQATWSDADAGLAFRRLAIIDLDERSMQPLHFGHLHLIANGEIYNYRELRDELRGLGHEFVTEGDIEVLLHAWAHWGEGALDRVNAMFACAVWDERDRTLTLASDPFGEKPLYWARDGERLLFGSDVRAIRAARPGAGTPDEHAVGEFLALGTMPDGERSFFADVRRLPGAHVLRMTPGGTPEVRRYWTPRATAVPADYAEAVTTLRELLIDSITLRLRSDVPVGTSLSGGVDSSAVVALAGSLAADARRHAFTASFPGFERDEWRYASEVAQAAGVAEHHQVTPTADEMLADLDALVRDQEEPFGTLSIYAQWRVNQAAHEAGVIVLLDGQGGDELFGGYPGTAGWALRAEGPRAVARGMLDARERVEVLTAIGADVLPRAVAHRHRRGLASPYATGPVVDAAVRTEPARPDGANGSSPLRRELLRQSFHTSLPALLRYADRDSMAHSREVRLPLLDRRIAEFALSCPPRFLYSDGETKRILRDAVADVVPPSVLARRDKVGFEPPQASWLSSDAARAKIADVLLDPSVHARGEIDTGAVEADLGAGAWRDHGALWRALSVELWRAGS